MAHKIYDPETQEARIFHEADCDLKRLKNKTVAVIGFGSQGHAHALNLKDSGIKVIIGLNKGGRTWPIAEKRDLKYILCVKPQKKRISS